MTLYQAEKALKNPKKVEPLSNQMISNPTKIIDAFRKRCVELCTSQSIRDQSKVEGKVLPIEASPLEFRNRVKDLLEVPCFPDSVLMTEVLQAEMCSGSPEHIFSCWSIQIKLVSLPTHCPPVASSFNLFSFCRLFPVRGRRLGGGLIPEARGGGGGFLQHHLRHARGDQRRPRQSPKTRRPEEDLQSCKNVPPLSHRTSSSSSSKTGVACCPTRHLSLFLLLLWFLFHISLFLNIHTLHLMASTQPLMTPPSNDLLNQPLIGPRMFMRRRVKMV